MVEQPSREIRIRDRWILVGGVSGVVGLVGVGLHAFVKGFAIEVVVLVATAVMLGAVAIARRWDKKAP